MALIRLAFGNFLPCPAKSGEAPARRLSAAGYPQQSTAFVGLSQNSEEPREITGVSHFELHKREGVMHLSASRKCEPPAQAVPGRHDLCGRRTRRRAMGICACFRAMWSCRAASASISTADFGGPSFSPRAPPFPETQSKARSKAAEKRPVEQGQKNYCCVRNTRGGIAVDGQTPGEAPQPLTLNHPASNPGRFSGRGSSFSGAVLRAVLRGSQFTNLWACREVPGVGREQRPAPAVAARWRLCPWREGSRAGP